MILSFLSFFPLEVSVIEGELREKVREELEESQEIHKLLRRAKLLLELASLSCKTEEAKRKAELLLRIAVVYKVRVKKLGGDARCRENGI